MGESIPNLRRPLCIKATNIGILLILFTAACVSRHIESVAVTNGSLSGIAGGSPVDRAAAEGQSTVMIIGSDDNGGYRSFCTGAVISNDIILTAAHCLASDQWPKARVAQLPRFLIFMGLALVPGEVDPQDLIAVDRFIINDNFAGNDQQEIGIDGRSDLAVLKLAKTLPTRFTAAKFLGLNQSLPASGEFVVTGYGLDTESYDETPHFPLLLRQMTYTDSQFEPETRLFNLLGPPPNIGIRAGDSGGPAFLKENGRLLLWGILSGFPAAYEDLRRHKAWLEQSMKTLGEEIVNWPL